MARRGIFKDKAPAEVVDYVIDWSVRLGTDIIVGAPVWTIDGNDAALILSSQSNTTQTATAVLSGGTMGETYSIKCTIITQGARTFEQTALLHMSVR